MESKVNTAHGSLTRHIIVPAMSVFQCSLFLAEAGELSNFYNSFLLSLFFYGLRVLFAEGNLGLGNSFHHFTLLSDSAWSKFTLYFYRIGFTVLDSNSGSCA